MWDCIILSMIVRQNPSLKWMNWGYPYSRKPQNDISRCPTCLTPIFSRGSCRGFRVTCQCIAIISALGKWWCASGWYKNCCLFHLKSARKIQIIQMLLRQPRDSCLIDIWWLQDASRMSRLGVWLMGFFGTRGLHGYGWPRGVFLSDGYLRLKGYLCYPIRGSTTKNGFNVTIGLFHPQGFGGIGPGKPL